MGGGNICTPMAPVLCTFFGCLSSDAIGSHSSHRQRVAYEMWAIDKGHSVHVDSNDATGIVVRDKSGLYIRWPFDLPQEGGDQIYATVPSPSHI